MRVQEPGKLELVFTPSGGGEKKTYEVHQFDGPGVAMGMYNTEESITGFAKASFEYALEKQWYTAANAASNCVLKKQGCLINNTLKKLWCDQ